MKCTTSNFFNFMDALGVVFGDGGSGWSWKGRTQPVGVRVII